MYTPISLPKITIASKPYENGTKLQIVGLALDYAGQSSTMILDVKIVAIDVCKKMYPSAKVNEKIHGCAELQNGRHFCAVINFINFIISQNSFLYKFLKK